MRVTFFEEDNGLPVSDVVAPLKSKAPPVIEASFSGTSDVDG